jgi:hypothetical protein
MYFTFRVTLCWSILSFFPCFMSFSLRRLPSRLIYINELKMHQMYDAIKITVPNNRKSVFYFVFLVSLPTTMHNFYQAAWSETGRICKIAAVLVFRHVRVVDLVNLLSTYVQLNANWISQLIDSLQYIDSNFRSGQKRYILIPRKNILKLLKLQNLVAKCCKWCEKFILQSSQILYTFVDKA